MRTRRLRLPLRGGMTPWLLGSVLVVACASLLATKIGDIQKTPGKYDGRSVTIAGTVTSAHNFLVVKYYDVDDGTGTIAVVTESALPNEGASVRVKGKVNQAYAIGSAHLVVILEGPPRR
ncbi:MAG: hypothetical protein LAO05_04605 [Acidobacteriia bacterium]|nr:hypothetical protein [Terriglobia bacterium]